MQLILRTFNTFIKDIATKPPLLFPFLGGFHVLLLCYVIWGLRNTPFGIPELVSLSWMLAYCTFWIAACDLKKWGAVGYLMLALLNVILYLMLKTTVYKHIYMSSMFVLDDIFCFFLLFFYKRFR